MSLDLLTPALRAATSGGFAGPLAVQDELVVEFSLLARLV